MNDKTKQQIMQNRELLKGYGSWDVGEEATDEEQKLPYLPPLKGKMVKNSIPLPLYFEDIVNEKNIFELLQERKSRRTFSEKAVTQKQLSFLLWATQGVRRFAGKQRQVTFRNVASAGSRHPFETYLFLNHVEGMPKGLYHDLPAGHELECVEQRVDYEEEQSQALCDQKFAAAAPVVFIWSGIPYRTEWRYGMKAAKYILMDAGHVCENLYLACEAAGCGTCAIGAYDQESLDELLGFGPGPSAETDYECAVYVAAVGRQKEEETKE